MTSISVVSNSTLEWNLISPADVTGVCVCLSVCAVAVAVFQSTKPSQKCSFAYLFKCLPLLIWLQLTCQAVALPKGSRKKRVQQRERESECAGVEGGSTGNSMFFSPTLSSSAGCCVLRIPSTFAHFLRNFSSAHICNDISVECRMHVCVCMCVCVAACAGGKASTRLSCANWQLDKWATWEFNSYVKLEQEYAK